MQRLFSTFPTGRPGAGLLLLRLAVGASLLLERIPVIGVIPQSLGFEVRIVLVCLGISMLCRLGTPVMGIVAAVIELLIAVSQSGGGAMHVAAGNPQHKPCTARPWRMVHRRPNLRQEAHRYQGGLGLDASRAEHAPNL